MTVHKPDTRAWWQRMGIIPNTFSIARIILSPLPAYMILHPQEEYPFLPWALPLWGAILVVTATIMATDAIDGFTARLTNSQTAIGEIIDPIGDKLLIALTFGVITLGSMLPQPVGLALFVLSMAPEVAIVGARIHLLTSGVSVSIPSNIYGKIKMVMQCVGLLCAIIPAPVSGWPWIAVAIIALALPFSYKAATTYIKIGLDAYHKAAL